MNFHSQVEVLKAVREKIADPQNWIQGEYAEDKDTNPVTPYDPSACRFCLAGAFKSLSGSYKAVSKTSDLMIQQNYNMVQETYDTLCMAIRRAVGAGVIDFNDSHTHAEVLALLDAQIAKGE